MGYFAFLTNSLCDINTYSQGLAPGKDKKMPHEKETAPIGGGSRPKRKNGNKGSVDLGEPRAIYDYLRKEVYKQDSYCRDAAMTLYNHARGIPQRLFVCGPSGSGKTFVFQCIKKLWPHTLFVNAASITGQGWKGDTKATSFLNEIEDGCDDYIIVFDEFDKLATPSYSSKGENLSASSQAEFLKLVEGQQISFTMMTEEGFITNTYDTSRMSFVFCGSFARKASEIAEKESVRQYGFGTCSQIHNSFDRELGVEDLIDAGVILELASRVTKVSNVRPLTADDYKFLLKKHTGSPVKRLEKLYNLKLYIPDEVLDSIAEETYRSGLGVRSAQLRIQQLIDNRLFDFTGKQLNTLKEIHL